MDLTTCYGCGRKFDESFSFCPNCGRKKGNLIEEMGFKSMKEVKEAIKSNIKTYKEKMKDTSEILELLEEKNRTAFEMQKRFTLKILRRFPEIGKIVKEDKNVEFQAFIINVPYMQEEDKYIHNCMLRGLARKNNNIANFSLGVEELASNLYEVNIPIWTDDPFGETALIQQFKDLEEVIPSGQKRFMYVAEPWYFLNRVHDFDGRWINWKVIFKIKPNEFDEFTHKFHEVPLNIQKFCSLKYANHFSTAGTAFDGESFLGIIEEHEKSKFMDKFRSIESSYPKGYKPTLEMIQISWDLLKEFGFFYFSLKKILSSEPSMFSKYIPQYIMETSKDELAIFTEQKILREKQKKDEILDTITEGLITMASEGQKGSMSEIAKPIPREWRNEYRIFGDAK